VISALLGSTDWDDAAEDLVRTSFWRIEGNRYGSHPLVRQFAIEKLGEGVSEAQQAVALAVTRHVKANADRARFGQPDPALIKLALDWCEAERRNLAACVRFASSAREWAAVVNLTATIFNFWQVRGHWAEAEPLYRMALDAARQAADRVGEAQTLNRLGCLADNQDHREEAEQRHLEALRVWRELGDAGGEGNTQKHLTGLYLRIGRFDEAETACRDALALLQQAGDRTGEAKTLAFLGNIHRAQSRLSEAESAYRESLEVSRRVGNPYDEGDALRYLGQVAHQEGKTTAAVKAFSSSLPIWSDFRDHCREGILLTDLARLRASTGDAEGARALAAQAAGVLESTEDRPALQAARALLAELAPVLQSSG
jgi:tetratricopeptide (TPR) repeat protein